MRRVTSWLHVWLESGRRVNPCRMVPSKEGRGTRAAAMTSRARCKVREPSIAALVRELRVAALVLRDWKKKIGEQKQASLSGEQDALGRGERPPVWGTG